jgi:hypothetical protein
MSTNKKDPEKFVYKSFPIDEKYLLTGEEKAKEKARLKAMVTSNTNYKGDSVKPFPKLQLLVIRFYQFLGLKVCLEYLGHSRWPVRVYPFRGEGPV